MKQQWETASAITTNSVQLLLCSIILYKIEIHAVVMVVKITILYRRLRFIFL